MEKELSAFTVELALCRTIYYFAYLHELVASDSCFHKWSQ